MTTLRQFGQQIRIGQRYRRRSTGDVIRIRQVHRADRTVEIVFDPARRMLGFRELRDRFELLGGGK